MKKIVFPSELSIFQNRIPNEYLVKFEAKFVANRKSGQIPSMDEWFDLVKSVITEEKEIPLEIWALCSKIAWIIADVSFFIEHIDLIEKFRQTPLNLGYFALGIVEFIDFTRGFKLLKEAFLLAESLKDWEALLDLATPYTLILNNSHNKNMIKDVLIKVKNVHREKFDSDPKFNHLIAIINIFAHDEKGKLQNEDDLKEAHKIIKDSNHHLYTALALAYLTSFYKDEKGDKYRKEIFKELELINARMRLIIALSNAAYHYVSKGDCSGASNHSAKALEVAKGITKAKDYGYGIYIYPLFQKAWLLVEFGQMEEAQEILQTANRYADLFKSPHYQAEVKLGLAYVFFLQNNLPNAFKHAKESINIVQSMDNPYVQNHYYLEYIDLLIDLKELEDIPEILEKIDIKELKGCANSQYNYIVGKYELSRYNVGMAKKYLEDALNNHDDCEKLIANISFTMAESLIHEYRISEDSSLLKKAQETITKGLDVVFDKPNRTKGKFLSAILLCAQKNYDEAEEVLEELTERSNEIPRYRTMAEKLLDAIRDTRVGNTPVSPISNVSDVLRYLRDAKTLIELNPR